MTQISTQVSNEEDLAQRVQELENTLKILLQTQQKSQQQEQPPLQPTEQTDLQAIIKQASDQMQNIDDLSEQSYSADLETSVDIGDQQQLVKQATPDGQQSVPGQSSNYQVGGVESSSQVSSKEETQVEVSNKQGESMAMQEYMQQLTGSSTIPLSAIFSQVGSLLDSSREEYSRSQELESGITSQEKTDEKLLTKVDEESKQGTEENSDLTETNKEAKKQAIIDPENIQHSFQNTNLPQNQQQTEEEEKLQEIQNEENTVPDATSVVPEELQSYTEDSQKLLLIREDYGKEQSNSKGQTILSTNISTIVSPTECTDQVCEDSTLAYQGITPALLSDDNETNFTSYEGYTPFNNTNTTNENVTFYEYIYEEVPSFLKSKFIKVQVLLAPSPESGKEVPPEVERVPPSTEKEFIDLEDSTPQLEMGQEVKQNYQQMEDVDEEPDTAQQPLFQQLPEGTTIYGQLIVPNSSSVNVKLCGAILLVLTGVVMVLLLV
eukprot:TRINITY_DN3753_c0_g1_i1.p1 TRINITY_DN3753_c0_g1~~TRINITY_DN3753_c0_g1_i1.p1  ORF type:complete len:542 (+),score=55.41 TRINITY_DN3753_c0_g1_i1:150-1628(+)